MPRRMAAAALVLLRMGIPCAHGQNCSATSTRMMPLMDLGAGQYLGQFEGGLYPGGSNDVPLAHRNAGLTKRANIQPLDTSGHPSPTGKYVLISIGMSNTTQEWCSQDSLEPCDSWTFMGQASADSRVND